MLLCALAAALAAAGAAPAAAPRGNLPGWHLVFRDDFTRGLDTRRWGLYSGQPGGDPGGWWDPSHAVVRNGILNLESYRDPRFGGRWVSAGASSARALKQTYGKYLVRFRFDPGLGIGATLLLWPSGNDWPPEIDFAEDGGETGARNHIASTLHYGSDNHQVQRVRRGDFSKWHVAGVEWTPGRLVYTLDGKQWGRVVSSGVPSQAMELDIQTQAGTCGESYAPCPTDATPSHVSLQVDWVVAYAYRPGSR